MDRETSKKLPTYLRNIILPPCLAVLVMTTGSIAYADTSKNAALNVSNPKVTVSPNDTLSLKYNLNRSELNLMKLKFNVSLKGDEYQASHNLKSKGLVKLFADMKSTASVEGKVRQASLMPLNFQISSGKKNKIKTAKLSWNDNKMTREVSPALGRDRAKSIDLVLNKDVTDPLTGLLSLVMFDDQKKPCNKTIRIFEGRKVFDLSYRYSGPSKLHKKDPGSFRGPVHRCHIKHTPVAGYSAKKMQKMLENNPTHTVWIARIKSPTSEKSYLVPVKMRVTTKFGLIDAVLDKGKINGKKLRKAATSL